MAGHRYTEVFERLLVHLGNGNQCIEQGRLLQLELLEPFGLNAQVAPFQCIFLMRCRSLPNAELHIVGTQDDRPLVLLSDIFQIMRQ